MESPNRGKLSPTSKNGSSVKNLSRLTVYQTVGLKKPKDFSAGPKTPHRFPKIEAKKEITIKPASTAEPEIDILCINCMKMVKMSLAAEHSLHCSQVQSDVKLIDQCSLMQQADYKIRKLKDSILQLNKSISLWPNDGYYIKMLTEYCGDLLQIADFTKVDILKCRELIFNLNSLAKGFKGSASVMVYLERLLVLSKEKYGQLLNYYKEIAIVDPAAMKSKEELKVLAIEKAEQLRRSLNTVSSARLSALSERKSQLYSPSQIKTKDPHFYEITSDAGINEKQSSAEKITITSVASIPSEGEKVKEVEEALKVEEKKKAQKDNLKRYFFTLVASAKKELGMEHMGYYADTLMLFNGVIKVQKSVDDWPGFIMKELKTNPCKWIEPSKLCKIQNLLREKALRNLTAGARQNQKMSTIKEEPTEEK